MSYNFNEEMTLNLNNTNLSASAVTLITNYLTTYPGSSSKDILQALYSDVIGSSPTIVHTDLYQYVFEEISQDGGNGNLIPKSGVDGSAWLWVRGAIQVNSDDGSGFSNFIRDLRISSIYIVMAKV